MKIQNIIELTSLDFTIEGDSWMNKAIAARPKDKNGVLSSLFQLAIAS